MSTSIYPSQDTALFDTTYYDSSDSGRGRILLWSIVGLATLGICISGYLTWTTWTASSVVGCTGDGQGCNHVLSSVWSKWLGLPVSLFGLLTYIGILASALMTTRNNQGWGPTLLLTLALSAAGSAAWFIGLQIFEIGHFCIWCMTVHCCSLVICTLTVVQLFLQGESAPAEQQMSAFFGGPVSPEVTYDQRDEFAGPVVKPILASAIACVGLVVLMAGQYFFKGDFQPSGLKYEEEVASVTPEESFSVEETASTTADAGKASLDGVPTADETAARESLVDEPDFAESDSEETPSEAPSSIATDDTEELDDEAFLDSLTIDTEEERTNSEVDSIFATDEAETAEADPVETPEAKQSESETFDIGSRSKDGRRLVTFASLKEPIDVTNVPILGNPEAEHVLVEMIDYTCPHCRNLHPHVESSLERYGDQVAFVIVHVPLSKKCNPYVKRDHWTHKNACDYARLSLSVWKLDRRKFAEFHSWLMKGKRPPTSYEARVFAMQLVGEEVLLSENLKAETLSSFAGNSDTMMRMNAGLPLVLTPKGKVSGIPTNEADWFNFLESRIGVKPLQ